MTLTDRFADALVFAESLHRQQTRKGNDVPYIAHLLAVAATALECGADEDTAIAALLHDAVEDQGGLATAREIRSRYGERVAEIVLACTDSLTADTTQKKPWENRKHDHVAKLATASVEVARVTAADKLHNLNSIIRDVRAHGQATMSRFAAPDRLVWYFGAIADALQPHAGSAPVSELRQTTAVLAQLLEPERVAQSSVK